MSDKPSLSVIICTRDRPHFIGAAVESVLANDHPSFEILVVDQSSDGSTAQALAALGDARVRYLHMERPGLSAASNAGVRAALGDILCFTDDDCRAPAGWLALYEEMFASNPNVNLIFGQMLAAKELANRASEIPTFVFHETKYVQREKDPPWIWSVGANYGVRRSLYESIGGHDESLGGGAVYENAHDFDFTYRAYRAGAGILLKPELYVWHYGERDPAQWRRRLRSYGIGDGAFYAKHIRCGDMALLKLFLTRFLRLTVREALNIVRHKSSKLPYLQGCLTGIMRSRKQAINRRIRLYS